MSVSRILYSLLAMISIGCAIYLYTKDESSTIQIVPDIELPAFSGVNVHNISYADTGIRSYTINSVHLEHFAQQGSTVFDSPVLSIYANGTTKEWEISADKAILDKDEVLTLYDNVLAQNLLPDSGFDTLSSQKMSIKLTNRDFWTDTKVIMLGPQFETHGEAMKGNFADNIAEVYNKVNSRYETLTP
ncbi:Lipopolysaccharide export system protein LptC [Vibrio thalassae]|uniref:Lipopolysaccharide export system protein LptC n=1 Tax=Vibrio thalassae TaxID=1243014 RepID=A0A240EB33_9VIBR|nr:LPS export ABC transporter periplasmic protein LptC [Vibrio thalassae]SNX45409.1 Lipopolysaccharide export system protein LptC [Vibrio thalassae]